MTNLALDISKFPAAKRTMERVGPQFAKRVYYRRNKIIAKAACQMADLLERQSELLVGLGMCEVAREACKEIRQLRLLAALES